jgi:SAM-dependent methyltransferase
VLIARKPFALLEITKFRRRAYAKLWLAWGASYAELLPGDTEDLLRTTSGVVLEIGAGSGELLHLYDDKKIEIIYGVEPAEDLYERLETRAQGAGFGHGRYVILKCGAEPEELVPALAKKGLLKDNHLGGLFDTIVCVRVLCMVPDLEETVRVLYRCLKPGGKLILCEHGINRWREKEGSIAARMIQWALMCLGWSVVMGDCHLDRHMQTILQEGADDSGGWAETKFATVDAWAVLPYTVGYLVK